MPGVERCTVRLDGTLTPESAEKVAEAAGCLRIGGALLVDLTRAQEVPAVILAQLVRLVAAHSETLTIRFVGLRQRDCQILGYLGLEIDQAGRTIDSSASRGMAG